MKKYLYQNFQYIQEVKNFIINYRIKLDLKYFEDENKTFNFYKVINSDKSPKGVNQIHLLLPINFEIPIFQNKNSKQQQQQQQIVNFNTNFKTDFLVIQNIEKLKFYEKKNNEVKKILKTIKKIFSILKNIEFNNVKIFFFFKLNFF
jgi:hypothetical protein